jgi:signal transduction histidine kinase/CheY-like chemotaxis protein/streptogramin lyase
MPYGRQPGWLQLMSESRCPWWWKCCGIVVVLLLLPLLLAAAAHAAVPATPEPRQITVADGLPSNAINDFAEDANGYLWLASGDGLARYDGRGYHIWRVENGLRDNTIWAVHVDARNRVWIGTENAGLVMLTADRSRFHFYDHRGYPQMLSSTVWCIESTSDGSIWFGTSAAGLYRLRPDGRMQRYQTIAGDPHSVPGNSIVSLVVTQDGALWVGTSSGVARWVGEGFERLQLPSGSDGSINGLSGLSIDPDGGLWIADSSGTVVLRKPDGRMLRPPWRLPPDDKVLSVLLRDRSGHYWLDTLSGLAATIGDSARNVPLYSAAAHGLIKPNWSAAYQDHEGGLWFASPNAGLWHLPPKWSQFAVLANRRNDRGTLANAFVLGAGNASNGGFWLVGTGGALDRLNPATGEVEHHLDRVDGRRWPLVVEEGGRGEVWIGMNRGLVRYDPADGSVRRWHDDSPKDAAMSGDTDMIGETADGILWFYSSSDGFQWRDHNGHVLRRISHDGHGLSRELAVNYMQRGPNGNLWLASSRGLLAWDAGSDRFVPVTGAPDSALYAFQVTGSGVVWLAGMGNLRQYLWDGTRLQALDEIGAAQRFPMLNPGGLVVDPSGVAWVSSMRGLIRVDHASRGVRIYDVHDGLPSQQFRRRTLLRSPNGQVIAATPDGLVLFDPTAVKPSHQQPQLMVEHMDVRRSGRVLDLTKVDTPVIADGDRDLRIVARLFSFSDTNANSYRFRLSGYDPEWVEVGPAGERLFSRLPAGRYILEVQGKTADSVWSQVKSVHFRVLPPWWLSPWGLALLVLLVLALTVATVLLYRRRLQRLHGWQLALQKQQLAEQASLAKTRFLATLGHEVRTPMTGVLGMSELLLNTELDAKQRLYTDSIRRAGGHLMRLVNDALDLARIESGRMELDLQPFSLQQLVLDVEGLMAPMAHSQGLQFVLQMAVEEGVTVTGDVTRIRQILLNLLGNAIKFTEYGSVTLKVQALPSAQGLRFEVADTGPGISAEQQARLFQRFEQGEGARTSTRYGGSGLGLAICQELTVAMDGNIEVCSRLGAGTRFVVELPLPWSKIAVAGQHDAVQLPSTSPLHILLVEDDLTIAEVIAGLLRAQGHGVVHAAHGLAALAELSTGHFDLALLDLDLPGLDGYALASQIRGLGYAMPLLAVTARSDEQAEPNARAAGFDDFLRKPVTGEMLAIAIAKALERVATTRGG